MVQFANQTAIVILSEVALGDSAGHAVEGSLFRPVPPQAPQGVPATCQSLEAPVSGSFLKFAILERSSIAREPALSRRRFFDRQ